jgi:HK97 family phage portal protein
MKLLGLEISIAKKAAVSNPIYSSQVYDRGWWPVVQEPFAGAWQRNKPLVMGNALQNATLYRCVSMISADIAKMRLKLIEQVGRVWQETTSAAFTPILTKPNKYQTRIQFFETWLISKLRTGNAYVLLELDQRNVVVAMYVLNPNRVRPLKASDGSIFYELNTDELAGITEDRVVVNDNIIMHDRMNCLFDSLVGMPPLYCANAPALSSLGMQEFSSNFFVNAARPSGILTAPGDINEVQVERLKRQMEQGYSEQNRGRVAVMGNGLKFEAMQQNAVDSQLIEQFKHNDESICTAFGVPAFMVGVKDPPTINNAELLDLQYYKQCLQSHLENIELVLSEGLGLISAGYRAEFDLTGLFRMDSQTQITVLAQAVDKGILTHNEARYILGYGDLPGGDTLFAQQQMFPLEVLESRTAAPALPAVPDPTQTPPTQPVQPEPAINQRALIDALRKEMSRAA